MIVCENLIFVRYRDVQLLPAENTICRPTERRRMSNYWTSGRNKHDVWCVNFKLVLNTITPVLQKLHWLPVLRRVEFNFACLVHQSLSGQTPTYLTFDIELIADTDRLSGSLTYLLYLLTPLYTRNHIWKGLT